MEVCIVKHKNQEFHIRRENFIWTEFHKMLCTSQPLYNTVDQSINRAS